MQFLSLRLLLSAAVCVVLFSGCSPLPKPIDESLVPDRAKQVVNFQFPNRKSRWTPETYGYSARLRHRGKRYKLKFSAKGQWLETECQAPLSQFPDVVLDRVRYAYPNYKIDRQQLEVTPLGRFYEIQVAHGSDRISLYYDESGNESWNFNEHEAS
jgi:hypothetical protein